MTFRHHLARCLALSLAAAVVSGTADAGEHDYMRIVRAYADAMIEHGRDRYGEAESPLFATTLDRGTLALRPAGTWIGNGPGMRSHDRMLFCANPMQDQNLCQVLYALAELTGEKRYADEADAALKWFFEHCQSPATGLMAWGEHLGWDFYTEQAKSPRTSGDIHEFYRPWVLWDRTYELAPDAALRFARGLWDHQIRDHRTGDFSRHAKYSRHGPSGNNQYPRHGGFYIATWAEAYRRTKDVVYVQATEALLGFYESHRSEASGAIPAEVGNSRSNGKLFWPRHTVSLAIDLWDAAEVMPAETARRMRDLARSADEVFVRIPNQLAGEDGFLINGHVDTLEGVNVRKREAPLYTRPWVSGYGQPSDACVADTILLRYGQVGGAGYRRLILAAAERYMTSKPDAKRVVYPGAVGDAIELLLGSHHLTNDKRYTARAARLADMSVEMFFDASCPLPRASTKYDHYEVLTGADTLMMSLLKLWIAQNRPDANVRLIWNDR